MILGLVYDTLADSAGTSRMFEVRGPLMRDAQYDPATATIRTHLKDVDIISAFATGLRCPTPLSPPRRNPIMLVPLKVSRCRIPPRSVRLWRILPVWRAENPAPQLKTADAGADETQRERRGVERRRDVGGCH